MKRSAQVALLFGGLAAAGTGAYAIMPANQACTSPQQPQAGAIPGGGTTAAGLAAPLPGAAVPATAPAALAAAGQPNPCERPRRRWYDSSYSSYNSGRYYGSRSIWGSRSSSTTTTVVSREDTHPLQQRPGAPPDVAALTRPSQDTKVRNIGPWNRRPCTMVHT